MPGVTGCSIGSHPAIPPQILLLLVLFVRLGVALFGRVLEAVVVLVVVVVGIVSKFYTLSNFSFACSPAVWVVVSLTTHESMTWVWLGAWLY